MNTFEIRVAKVLSAYREQLQHPTCPAWVDEHYLRDLVVPLAHALRRDNPQLDYAEFISACGAAETVPGYTSRGAKLLQAVSARQRAKGE